MREPRTAAGEREPVESLESLERLDRVALVQRVVALTRELAQQSADRAVWEAERQAWAVARERGEARTAAVSGAEQELSVSQEEIRVQNEQLREIQQHLELALSRYADLYDFAPMGYAMLDRHGLICDINLTGAGLLGLERSYLLGQPLRVFVAPAEAQQLDEHLLQCRDSGAEVSVRIRMRQKDGHEFPAQLTSQRVEHPEGASEGAYRTAITDLSALEQAEEQRRAAQLAEHAARAAAEAKDHLIAMVSHELRTPLSAVLLWARILQLKLSERSEHAHALEVIVRSAETQRQLIDDLLDISRISSGKLRLQIGDVDLSAVLKTAIESISPTAQQKGIRIVTDLRLDDGLVRADPERLQQVFGNLLNNAVKFTPREGHVRVSAQRVGGEADVRVADDGEGIEPKLLPHIFEAFRQSDRAITTRAHGGLGLGLAITRQIIELHGGSIHATSDGRGCGALFAVRLPLRDGKRREAERTAQSSAAGAAPAPVLAGCTVLLVEDEEATLSALTTVIAGAGARVAAVQSAEAAVEAFQRERPDLIVSDIGMAGEDGYQMMRRLRALESSGHETRTVPALALTAFASIADSERALSAGFTQHMPKPIAPEPLLAALQALRHDSQGPEAAPAAG